MDSREFIHVCEAAEHGRERLIRYISRHEGDPGNAQVGRVVSCDGRRFEVEAENGRHSWPMEWCEPVRG
jgi:hypothetical protein